MGNSDVVPLITGVNWIIEEFDLNTGAKNMFHLYAVVPKRRLKNDRDTDNNN